MSNGRVPDGNCWSWMRESLTSPAQQSPVFLNSPSQRVPPSQELSHVGSFISPCTSLIRAGLLLPKLTQRTEHMSAWESQEKTFQVWEHHSHSKPANASLCRLGLSPCWWIRGWSNKTVHRIISAFVVTPGLAFPETHGANIFGKVPAGWDELGETPNEMCQGQALPGSAPGSPSCHTLLPSCWHRNLGMHHSLWEFLLSQTLLLCPYSTENLPRLKGSCLKHGSLQDQAEEDLCSQNKCEE